MQVRDFVQEFVQLYKQGKNWTFDYLTPALKPCIINGKGKNCTFTDIPSNKELLMPHTKPELISDLRSISASLTSEMTSARLASSAYSIMDLLILMNTIDPGSSRKEIIDLSVVIDKDVYHTLEIARDIYIANIATITEAELIEAKNKTILKIRGAIKSCL
jgi:hypothetical protein